MSPIGDDDGTSLLHRICLLISQCNGGLRGTSPSRIVSRLVPGMSEPLRTAVCSRCQAIGSSGPPHNKQAQRYPSRNKGAMRPAPFACSSDTGLLWRRGLPTGGPPLLLLGGLPASGSATHVGLFLRCVAEAEPTPIDSRVQSTPKKTIVLFHKECDNTTTRTQAVADQSSLCNPLPIRN